MEAELSQWSKFSCQETEKEKQIQEMEEFKKVYQWIRKQIYNKENQQSQNSFPWKHQ